MALGRDFLDFAEERLAPLGAINIKKMFGGAGVYCDGLFFALLDDDQLFFKTDDGNRAAFEAEGLKPFVFRPKEGPAMTMGYHAAPESVWDDEDDMLRWGGLALAAARRAATRKTSVARKSAQKSKSAAGSRKRS